MAASHHTPSRLGRSLSMSTPIRFDPKSIDLGGKSAKEIENLYWGGADDESFEVPDFHFDWGVVKPAEGTASAASTTTPSSVAVVTPESGDAKKLLSSRTFSRHVSAPLAKGWDERKDSPEVKVLDALNETSSQTRSARPHLTHTSSASSVIGESATERRTAVALGSRSTFVTPGLHDRTLSAASTSSTRRLGGLSKFGGPARRVVVPELAAESSPEQSSQADESPRSNLGQSPPRSVNSSRANSIAYPSPPPLASDSSSVTVKPTSPLGSSAYLPSRVSPSGRSRASALQPTIREDRELEDERPRSRQQQRIRSPEPERRHRHSPSLPSPPSTSPAPQDRWDQENRPGHYASKSVTLTKQNQPATLASYTSDRPAPQPLRPAHHLVNQTSATSSSSSPAEAYRQQWHADERVRESSPHTATATLRPSRAVTQPTPTATYETQQHQQSYQPQTMQHLQSIPQQQPQALQVYPSHMQAQASHLAGPSHQMQPPPLPPAPAPPRKAPFVINGSIYERVDCIGKGGSSRVFSVLCPTTRNVLALKRVTLDRADKQTVDNYLNEISLLQRLKGHDQIIRLIDHQVIYGTRVDRPKSLLMLMECGEIAFDSLLDEQKGKPVNMNFVGLYWEQMLQAVHAVHLEKVVHTDLKPANFVLVKGRLKIIDFGIAKAIANDTVNIQRESQMGTTNYMSPEAILRMHDQAVHKLSYPSDVWSLGCILYQMIYGQAPFAHIAGGPMPRLTYIANENHIVKYPDIAVPKSVSGGAEVDSSTMGVPVSLAAVDTMKKCLEYRKEKRLTIPQLLEHEFLKPRRTGGLPASSLPTNATSITEDQMAMLINYVLRSNGSPALSLGDSMPADLFTQLKEQNANNAK